MLLKLLKYIRSMQKRPNIHAGPFFYFKTLKVLIYLALLTWFVLAKLLGKSFIETSEILSCAIGF